MDVLLTRAKKEVEEVEALSGLMVESGGTVVCQEVSEHTPDFRFVSLLFKEALAATNAAEAAGLQAVEKVAREKFLNSATKERIINTILGVGPTRRRRRLRQVKLLKVFKVFNRTMEVRR